MFKRATEFLLMICATCSAQFASAQWIFPVEAGPGTGYDFANLFDHAPARDTFRDWNCDRMTFDGSISTDIGLADYVAMYSGARVVAVADGVVLATRDGLPDVNKSTDTSALGNFIQIRHDSLVVTYTRLRLSSIQVKPGDIVKQGDLIGLVGASGISPYPYLHFEVWNGTTPIDPFGDACGAQIPNLFTNANRPTPFSVGPETFGFLKHVPTLDELERRPGGDSLFTTDTILCVWFRGIGEPLNVEWSDPSHPVGFGLPYSTLLTFRNGQEYFSVAWLRRRKDSLSFEAGPWYTRFYDAGGSLMFTAGVNVVALQNAVSTSRSLALPKVFPGPGQEEATITFDLNANVDVRLDLYDQLGDRLQSQNFSSELERGLHAHTFQLHGLPAGIYFARLDTSTGGSYSFKVVKE